MQFTLQATHSQEVVYTHLGEQSSRQDYCSFVIAVSLCGLLITKRSRRVIEAEPICYCSWLSAVEPCLLTQLAYLRTFQCQERVG